MQDRLVINDDGLLMFQRRSAEALNGAAWTILTMSRLLEIFYLVESPGRILFPGVLA
jgi:hypothetical protein